MCSCACTWACTHACMHASSHIHICWRWSSWQHTQVYTWVPIRSIPRGAFMLLCLQRGHGSGEGDYHCQALGLTEGLGWGWSGSLTQDARQEKWLFERRTFRPSSLSETQTWLPLPYQAKRQHETCTTGGLWEVRRQFLCKKEVVTFLFSWTLFLVWVMSAKVPALMETYCTM